MIKISILNILLLATCTSAAPKLAVSSYSLILSNTSFTQFLIFEQDETIKSCRLSFTKMNTTEMLSDDLDINNEVTFKYDDDIVTLGRGYCGYKHSQYHQNKYMNGSFNLDIDYYENGHEEKISITYFILSLEKLVISDKEFEFDFGQSATFKYGGNFGKYTLRLFNPKGELVSFKQHIVRKESEFEIDYVTSEHIGTWIAEVGAAQTIDSVLQRIEIKAREPERVTHRYEEGNVNGTISCELENLRSFSPVSHDCTFEVPNGMIINSTKDRYFLEKSLKNNTCQVQFELPLQENEIGNWKCIFYIEEGLTGTLVPINQSTPLPFEKNVEEYATVGEPYDLICKVPYSSENCIIISPNGETIVGGTKRNFGLGECKISFKQFQVDHIGTYTCIFSNPDALEDDIITYELKIH